ncbi:Vegetative incompatibility protein HET-E-1 [Tolypocladium paradoxum]|uniref:Vegetative incompatibility protein HET-E-1 n=1 Tax=Tolypocladium paradoxum TaxID=94208 RepID=A0A2S4KWI5_9HYPO|nr:Vegetative incompatibility protein HET-E-1 [Tolypocladium paradoxum]
MTILGSPDLYTIGWITALPIECAAATALLDDRHNTPEGFEQHQSDTNSYTWGRMGEHNIVIASLPARVYGTTFAATTASNLLSSLPQIRIGLVVGIGGGIARPVQDRDIRLGDVVVGQPDGIAGGVVQYDLGKAKPNETWERKGRARDRGIHDSGSAPSDVEGQPRMTRPKSKVPGFVHQGFENDRLFKPTYNHAGGSTCAKCEASWEVERDQRNTTDPEIHCGVIASGNTLVKDATTRDIIAEVVGADCVCFEMEAAGLMNHFSCLVIRGICNYADSHTNDRWQRYASATAAARRCLIAFPLSLGPPSTPAEEHNPTCFPNTRVELLDQITQWAENSRAESIFWLNGMAGTGKSTISRTISRSFDRAGNLGASFFFKRGDGDRGSSSKLFTTVAAQLATSRPAVAPYIKNAIDADFAIGNKGLREQFDKLVLQPLSAVSLNERGARCTIILIDALDECEIEDKVKLIIDLFGHARILGLRYFITSRPELPVRLGFHAIEGKHQDVILHKTPEAVIGRDLSVFLEHELATIRAEYNASVPDQGQLPINWPGQSNFQCLVKMATPLFIFAATVCRFLADRRCGNPEEQLQEVLRFRTRSQESQLDATYLPVLNKLVAGLPTRKKDKVLQQFRSIVGSIIILASPLSTAALAQILSMSQGTIDSQLSMLHSVLSIPQSAKSPVSLLHLSFRDFLLDPEKQDTNLFWIDEARAHIKMASNCLRIMKESLRVDICGLRSSKRGVSTIDYQKINECIPAEVQYACLHWVFHLHGARSCVGDFGEACLFLKNHFLHWIEALSLMRRAPESIGMIRRLQGLIQTNLSIISSAPLQIYSSVLLFSPQRSIIKNLFESEIPNWISLKPQTVSNWDRCIQKLEGHDECVTSVAFSHDSGLVASASVDTTVRLWRATMDDCVEKVNSHSDGVFSISLSHDSALVASGSFFDTTVRLWRTNTGECVELKGHSGGVNAVVFSHDSALVASASHDKTVRLWRADVGEDDVGAFSVQSAASTHHATVSPSQDLKRFDFSYAFSKDSQLDYTGWVQFALAAVGISAKLLSNKPTSNTPPAFLPPTGNPDNQQPSSPQCEADKIMGKVTEARRTVERLRPHPTVSRIRGPGC